MVDDKPFPEQVDAMLAQLREFILAQADRDSAVTIEYRRGECEAAPSPDGFARFVPTNGVTVTIAINGGAASL